VESLLKTARVDLINPLCEAALNGEEAIFKILLSTDLVDPNSKDDADVRLCFVRPVVGNRK